MAAFVEAGVDLPSLDAIGAATCRQRARVVVLCGGGFDPNLEDVCARCPRWIFSGAPPHPNSKTS
jgi:hypothetical protein